MEAMVIWERYDRGRERLAVGEVGRVGEEGGVIGERGLVGRAGGEVRKFSSHLNTVPHLHERNRSVEEVVHATPLGSTDDVVGPGHDIWLVSISLGVYEDTVLVHLVGSILDCHNDMCPRGRVKVARGEGLIR